MNSYTKHSIVGSAIALIVSLNCCWLPALIIAIGGGSTLIGLRPLKGRNLPRDLE